MCTVSFIARQNGYALGMNRDEKVTRVPGLPPKKFHIGERAVVCPSEPGGGTWIALNDAGITFALINWYSVPATVEGGAVSRGRVISAVCATDLENTVAGTLEQLPLGKINPFRLVGIFPKNKQVMEWRWDLRKLVQKQCRWERHQWISSGFDERTAQLTRARTFDQAIHQRSAGSLAWLRRLHRSHSPQMGPFSTCMHRADAATVSFTEVRVGSRRATMRHQTGAPCQPSATFIESIVRLSPDKRAAAPQQ
jgi:hypothetical protein